MKLTKNLKNLWVLITTGRENQNFLRTYEIWRESRMKMNHQKSDFSCGTLQIMIWKFWKARGHLFAVRIFLSCIRTVHWLFHLDWTILHKHLFIPQENVARTKNNPNSEYKRPEWYVFVQTCMNISCVVKFFPLNGASVNGLFVPIYLLFVRSATVLLDSHSFLW